jgi:hypothetical protein
MNKNTNYKVDHITENGIDLTKITWGKKTALIKGHDPSKKQIMTVVNHLMQD